MKITPHELLHEMPNLVGDVARYIYSTLQYDQPIIAIGAALSFVGFLKSKRYTNKYNISPNVYACAIADSGTGKSQCQEAIQNLAVKAGMAEYLMGKPKSDSGLLSAFSSNYEARQFLVWDEFGIALGALSKSQNSFQAMILSTIMELFSAGNRLYIGDQYSARTGAQKRVDIDRPQLSIFAASTPNRFFGALSEEFVFDGLLSRWLLCFGNPTAQGKTPENAKISGSLLEEVVEVQKGKKRESGGDIEMLTTPREEVVRFDARATLLIDNFIDVAKYKVSDSKSSIERIFNTRRFEHVVKIATISAHEDLCKGRDLEYALHLSDFLIGGAISSCAASLFDTQLDRAFSKLKERMLAAVRVGDVVSKSVLGQKFPANPTLRAEVLRELVDTDQFEQQIVQLPGSHKKRTQYVRLR
jgi:hypothetical protein